MDKKKEKFPKSARLPKDTQITFNNGEMEISDRNTWLSLINDPYHLLLTISWPGFILFTGLIFVGLNVFFAWLYFLVPNCISNTKSGDFLDLFFFSIQTFGSIGYGHMYPVTLWGHIIVSVESFVAILSIALTTGIAFSRFSKPSAQVVFSKTVTITSFDGHPTLMFRVANRRLNQIVDARVSLYMLVDSVTNEGHFVRRIHQLQVLRPRTPTFSLAWSVMHQIDENSPLHGETAESLQDKRAVFSVSLIGIDETLSQTIHARHTYSLESLVWGGMFEELYTVSARGKKTLNYSNFHKVRVEDSPAPTKTSEIHEIFPSE